MSLSRNLRQSLPTLAALTLTASLAVPLRGGWWAPWKKTTLPTPPAAAERGKNVRLRFVGNRQFSEGRLRSAIREPIERIRSDGLSRPNADDAAYYTAAFYHENGHAHAEVSWEIRDEELVLDIREGVLVQLRSCGITGNQSLSSARLLARLTSATTERMGLPGKHLPFVLDDLRRGAGRISELYQIEGFINANVSAPEAVFSEDGTSADVSIHVEEGTRFSFGAVRFSGGLVYPEDALREALAASLKLPYTPARVAALQSTLTQFYAERAHFEPRVFVEALPDAAPSGSVPVHIRVEPGPQYVFQGVDIRGLKRLREDWLQNRLASLQGKPFHPDALARKQAQLMASDIFDALRVTPIPQPDHTLRLEIDASEAKSRDIGFSLGYGSYEGAIGGILFADRNLLGLALPASAELAFSERAISLETTLKDPWLFETRTEFVSRAFIRSRVEMGYEKREAGARAELSRRLFSPLQVALFGQVRTTEITTADISNDLLGPTSYQTVSAGISTTLDKRDSTLNPSTGWVAALLADTNTLSTGATFGRTAGRLAWHYPLANRLRLALSGRFGFLPHQAGVPIDERYFLGGANTVRSFKERTLGTSAQNPYPTGGYAYSLLNAELDFPLWNKLRGAAFYDAGSLSQKGGTFATADFRTALGLGLRYALPVGPVRVDVGFNPDRHPEETWGAAHLSFGFAF